MEKRFACLCLVGPPVNHFTDTILEAQCPSQGAELHEHEGLGEGEKKTSQMFNKPKDQILKKKDESYRMHNNI